MAEYIVLSIGIFFKKLLKNSKNFFPIKDSESQPIKVIRNKAINISTPVSYTHLTLPTTPYV